MLFSDGGGGGESFYDIKPYMNYRGDAYPGVVSMNAPCYFPCATPIVHIRFNIMNAS